MTANNVHRRIGILLRSYSELSAKYKLIYIINVVVTYLIIAFLLYIVIDILASNARQPTRDTHYLATVAPAFRQWAIAAGLAVYVSAWVASVAAPPDRRVVLQRCFWFFAPTVLLIGVAWMLRLGFWAISQLQFLILIIPIGLVGVFAVQVSSPMLRSWMYRKAVDPVAVAKAERRLHWPLQPDDWEEYEITIPADKYYGLLAGIFTILFIMLETTVGELLSDLLGTAGYAEASLIALFVGALIYPFHSWTSGQFAIVNRHDDERSGDGDEPLLKQFVTKTRAYYRIFFVQYWYLIVFAVILGAFGQKALVRYFPLY